MNTSLFTRYKDFVNARPLGSSYTTDELYKHVGKHESITGWKRDNRHRMFTTSRYQGVLGILGAVKNPKRGTWTVEHRIPEWFTSHHMNYLMGYCNRRECEMSVEELTDVLYYSKEIAQRIHIPENQRENPFKIDAYKFGSSLEANDHYFNGPFLINKNLWPEMHHKALIVSSGFEPEIINRKGNYYIILKPIK